MAERKINIYFRWTNYNHYSISALLGLLDDKLDETRFTVSTVESAKDIIGIANNSAGKVVIAYSFASTEAAFVKEEIKYLKSILNHKVTIICGGPHTAALPEDVLGAGADVVFIGEAEESLPCFLSEFYETGALPQNRVIAALPLKDFDSYPPFAYKRKFFGPVEIRRGCLNRCSFCQTGRIFPKIRERSIDYVKTYIKEIAKTKKDRIAFTITDALSYGSDGKTVNLEHLEKFLSEISVFGIDIVLGSFPSEISPYSLARYPEAAKLLKKYVKNTKISIGCQSASQRMLDIMKRGHTVEDAVNSIKLLKQNNFKPIVDMLLGVPGETKQDRLATIKFMEDIIGNYGAIPNLHYFMPLPGTPFKNLRPEPVENDLKEKLFKYMKNGVITGDFFKQMKYLID